MGIWEMADGFLRLLVCTPLVLSRRRYLCSRLLEYRERNRTMNVGAVSCKLLIQRGGYRRFVCILVSIRYGREIDAFQDHLCKVFRHFA